MILSIFSCACLAIHVSPLEKYLFISYAHWKDWVICHLCDWVVSFLFILDTSCKGLKGLLTAVTIHPHPPTIIICLNSSLGSFWPERGRFSLFSSFIWAPALVVREKFCPLQVFLNFQSVLLSFFCLLNGRILEPICLGY